MKKIILVTGGTGFLGEKVINLLLKNNFEVKCLTRSVTRYKNSTQIKYVKGDILNKKSIKENIKNCYGVIHIAGEKIDVTKMEQINIEGTKNICDISNTSSLKFFCHVSSIGVVGFTDFKLIKEDVECNPTNTYEKSKLIAENYVLNNFNNTNCSSIIIRPTNVFGKPHLKFSRTLIDKIKRWIKGNEIANYVYVKDVASVILHFLKSNENYNNAVFNVNDDSAKNRFKSIFKIVNGRYEFLFFAPILVPWILRCFKLGENNMGNKKYSIEKLKATGFKFSYGLEKGIVDALSEK